MRTLNKILFIFLIVIITQGCEGFLEEDAPSMISPNNFFLTANDLNSAIVGAYEPLRLYTRLNFLFCALYPADEIWTGSTGTASRIDLDTYSFTPGNGNLNDMWNWSYTGISRANNILANADKVKEAPVADRNRVKGEAYFLRALHYFNLVRFWGDVPLITSVISEISQAYTGRTPASVVYDTIISDCKKAETLIDWVVPPAASIGRAGKAAAKTQLAAVYLYLAGNDYSAGNPYWALARDKAKEVMDYEASGAVGLHPDVSFTTGLWKQTNEGHKEFIFSAQAKKGINGTNLMTFMLPHGNITNGDFTAWGTFGIEWPFYYKYDTADKRRDLILTKWKFYNTNRNAGRPDMPLTLYPVIMKWFEPDFANYQDGNTSGNYPIYRYPEALLTYAEAANEANGSPTQAAYDAINKVRNRAGLANLSGLSREQFRAAVILERSFEFAAEGKRFFDLKRTHTLIETMSATDRTGMRPLKPIQPFHYLYPLPEPQLSSNRNLTQNPGY